MRAWRMAAMVAASFLLWGCAGSERPLTLKEYYGFCWPAQIDSGCWDDTLCDEYRDYLAQEHANKQECIKGCQELQNHKYMADAARGCNGAVINATDWCETYCRRLFDYGTPGQEGAGQ